LCDGWRDTEAHQHRIHIQSPEALAQPLTHLQREKGGSGSGSGDAIRLHFSFWPSLGDSSVAACGGSGQGVSSDGDPNLTWGWMPMPLPLQQSHCPNEMMPLSFHPRRKRVGIWMTDFHSVLPLGEAWPIHHGHGRLAFLSADLGSSGQLAVPAKRNSNLGHYR